MKLKKSIIPFFLYFILTSFLFSLEEKIPPPEEILGFKIGEDFKLANWAQIVDYFTQLDKTSSRVKVFNLGQSTLGRKFIMAAISSPENLSRLEEIKAIQRKLQEPRKISEKEAKKLSEQGRAVVLISCSIHSTEIASSLMSMELVYQLATADDPQSLKILNEVVLLLIPSVNPDGIDLVYDWYNKYLDTPYEACPMPWLYHYYVGHDNNRDWFMVSQKETQLLTNVLYHEWFPIIVYDVHQMGKNGARLFIPPYYDPINPNIDPLLLRELHLITAQMAWDLTQRGKKGVATHAIFDAWYNMANRASPLRHNVIGILSEAASVNIASPIFLRKKELKLTGRGFFGSDIQSSYLEPWPGGWWRIRDIIDYEEIISFSLLQTVATRKKEFLFNYYLFGQRQIEKGKNEPPFAYLVPLDQRDYPTALKLIKVLHWGGAEIRQSKNSFEADKVIYPSGTWVIPLAQPYRAFIKDLLEYKVYPLREIQKGILERPYDEASWTLPLQMGVKVIEVTNPFQADLIPVNQITMPEEKISGKGNRYYLLSNQTNDEVKIINRLLQQNIQPYILSQSFTIKGKSFSPGCIAIPVNKTSRKIVLASLKELGVSVYSTNQEIKVKKSRINPPQLGIYQSWVPNMDEGWLRWVLEKFEFPFRTIHNDEMKAGDLIKRYQTIILPNMNLKTLIEGQRKGEVPPQYSGGLGQKGITSLENFVTQGGKLITIGHSSDLAIQYLDVAVKNLLPWRDHRKQSERGDEEKERIYCPGSILKVKTDNSHPVGYGLSSSGAIFFRNSPVFEVEKGEIIARYPDYNPLLSGIIENGEKLQGKASAVECPLGKGKVIMFGFKPIHRAQAHGTFKFIFNAILYL